MSKLIIAIFALLLPYLGYKVYAQATVSYPVFDETRVSTYYLADSVQDGDTLTLHTGESIRMLGYNTVEQGKRGYYQQGKKLADFVINKKLQVIRLGTDKYGRTLGVVLVSGKCVNTKMRNILKRWKVKEYDKYDYLTTKRQKEVLAKYGINLK